MLSYHNVSLSVTIKKGETVLSQEYLLFLFYGSMHFFIHSYPSAILRFLFVIELAEKLYEISHALSIGGQNAGGTPYSSLIKDSTLLT